MKKYIAKLKSIKELMILSDGFGAERDLRFIINSFSWKIFPKNLEQYCEKEIILLPTGVHNEYKTEISKYVVMNEWFSEIKEIEESEIWKPKSDEEFVVINSRSQSIPVTQDYYNEIAKDNIKNYNYYKTKEEAEKVEKAMKLYRAMKRWSYDNDDGNEFDKKKSNYIIRYNTKEKKYDSMYSSWINSLTNVYFSTEEKAKHCQEWLKKEGLI